MLTTVSVGCCVTGECELVTPDMSSSASVQVDEAGTVTFLTTDDQEVTKVLAYDETNKLM